MIKYKPKNEAVMTETSDIGNSRGEDNSINSSVRRNNQKGFKKSNKLAASVLIVICLVAMFPIVWLVATSFRTKRAILENSFSVDSLTMLNFEQVFSVYDFGAYLENSVVVTMVTVALVTVIAIPAAYALARLRIRGYAIILALLLLVRMIPIIALAIPLFDVFARIGLLDSVWSLILAQTAAKLPVATWLLLGFTRSIPEEIEEAARVDGAGRLRTLIQIVCPLIAPGIAASAILTFIFTWNDLVVALTLTSSKNSQTLPVGLTNFISLYGIDWGPMAAAAVLMIIPTVVFVWVAQRHLVSGLAAGAVK